MWFRPPVVETGPCIVVQKKVATTDGYNALQVGFRIKKKPAVNKAAQGHMAKAGKGAFEVLREFRLEDVGPYEIGQEIKAGDLFKVGDRIDVSGTSKGHGFSGVIKRWSFGGFPVLTAHTNIFATAAPSGIALIRSCSQGKKNGWPLGK
jgi:large subunit ribosomal protein L3